MSGLIVRVGQVFRVVFVQWEFFARLGADFRAFDKLAHKRALLVQHLVLFVRSLVDQGLVVVLASTSKKLSYHELLPAPVSGACALRTLVTVSYSWGVSPYVTTIFATIISAALLGIKLMQSKGGAFGQVDVPLRVLCLGFMTCVSLLPHHLGRGRCENPVEVVRLAKLRSRNGRQFLGCRIRGNFGTISG